MPRSNNPGDIKTGPGKQVPGETTLELGGPGMVGPGPNIGEVEGEPPFGPGDSGGGASAALEAHIHSGHAHPATAIWTEEGPSTLPSDDVEGELDELAGALPPEPPFLGYVHTHLTFTGVPDWGDLKLADIPLSESIPFTTPNDDTLIYPYWYVTPTPTTDPEFTIRGNDPQSDWTFNSGQVSAPGGPGACATGAYNQRPPVPSPVVPTHHIIERGAFAREAQVSGSIYPADRGVLALLHWPAEGGAGGPATIADFLAQDLLDRCICAILMGQGILGKGPCSDGSCDGGIGGIFDEGTDANGEYDPFSYPGQAGGQYDLHEIATGVSDVDGQALRPPWDDKNLSGSPGWKRVQGDVLPGPGQVRLGTDPAAGVPVEPYGIPILGSDQDAYDDGFGFPPAGPIGKYPVTPVGWAFFRYRLPYLEDYTQATGLKWTPGGITGTETTAAEKARYFQVPPLGVAPGVSELAQAGDYPDFPEDDYSWQVARYRAVWVFDYNGGPGDYEAHGTYFLVHFKREQDFEAFVRDGVMPDDVTNGYEIYSAEPAFLPDPSIEDTANRVNEVISGPGIYPPEGSAPTYGYKAWPYHVMRVDVFEDPAGLRVLSPDILSAEMSYVFTDTVFVSGVEYYIPRIQATGFSGVRMTARVRVANFWQNTYRTDDRDLADPVGITPPALLSAPNPAVLGLSPFSYETGTYLTGTGPAGSFYTADPFFFRRSRIEIPYTHLNGAGAYSAAAGPPIIDNLEIDGGAYPGIDINGDRDEPAISTDARVRCYLRKPRGNTEVSAQDGIQPVDPLLGQGIRLNEAVAGDMVLFHSTSFDPINLNGHYGNFMQGGPSNPAYSEMITTLKDTEERFLDEIYRYTNQFPFGIDATFGAGAAASLNGPGLGTWVPSPIETPVRIGSIFPTALWASGSYVRQGIELIPLANGGPTFWYAQVAGLPDRNPYLGAGAQVPFPSSGILLYPHHDYSAGYTPVGPDYSALTGLRTYTRCFDVGFNGTVAAAGQPFLTLRIDGLQLQDYEYTAPGPGTVNSTEGIAIHVKVPGLTTWLDIGRPDGSGPSKQDAVLDGAGCKVIGPETFDGVDDVTQHVYSQVKINVGPAINLFANTGIDNVTPGYVPVLVRVVLNEQAAAFNLERAYDPNTRTFVSPAVPPYTPSIESPDTRGLLGIKVV